MSKDEIIIINTSTKYSGLGRYARDLSKATDGDLLSVRIDKSISRDQFDGRIIDALFIPGLGSGWYLTLKFPSIFLRKLKKMLYEQYRDAIIHYSSQGIPHLIENSKTVTTIHDLFNIKSPNGDFSSKTINRMINGLNDDSRILTVSQYMKKKLTEIGIRGKMDVIYPAINSVFHPLNNKIEIRRRLGIPEDKIMILNVSSLDRRKNIRAIIETREKLDGSFLFAHVGPEIPGFLNFTRVDDTLLNDIYNSADIFLFPSLDEGFGYPVVEAMAAGIPVVASNIEVFREIVADSALLVDPNPNDLVCGIKEALNSKEELISKGIERSVQFDFQHFKEKIESYYSQLDSY